MADQKQYLLIPGPTPVPTASALAGAAPMINHRSAEFGRLLGNVTGALQRVLQTRNQVLIFPGAGTGAMEAAAVNLISPGERVLVTVAGEFGARFAEIIRDQGGDVRALEFAWGKPVDPEAVGTALRSDPSVVALVVTHNETSTGVTMDLAALRSVIPREEVLFIVDAVSSAGAIDLRPDDWGVDVVVTASQKGLMTPPGLALVALSEKAWEKAQRTPCRSYYWSFSRARRYLERPSPQTPYTPAVSLLYALRESLRQIETEGLAHVFRRHTLLARAVRAGIRALGLELLAEDAWASPTVTAVKAPPWLEVKRLLRELEERYGVVLAGGQGPLAGKLFRIGHVGHVAWSDVVVALAALEMAYRRLGGQVKLGNAVAAAEEAWEAAGAAEGEAPGAAVAAAEEKLGGR